MPVLEIHIYMIRGSESETVSKPSPVGRFPCGICTDNLRDMGTYIVDEILIRGTARSFLDTFRLSVINWCFCLGNPYRYRNFERIVVLWQSRGIVFFQHQYAFILRDLTVIKLQYRFERNEFLRHPFALSSCDGSRQNSPFRIGEYYRETRLEKPIPPCLTTDRKGTRDNFARSW